VNKMHQIKVHKTNITFMWITHCEYKKKANKNVHALLEPSSCVLVDWAGNVLCNIIWYFTIHHEWFYYNHPLHNKVLYRPPMQRHCTLKYAIDVSQCHQSCTSSSILWLDFSCCAFEVAWFVRNSLCTFIQHNMQLAC